MLLLSGWRWESYGGIEVGVPDSWKWGTSDSPWCLEKPAGPPTPYVGRPGVVPAIGCMATPGQVSDPAYSIEKAGTFVWFSKSVDTTENAVVVKGDRATLTAVGIELRVQAPKAMRDAILGTLHPIPRGTNGCPLTHPISDNPAWRPSPRDPVEELTGVTTISACKYGEEFLVSSVKLKAKEAAKAFSHVAAAPSGGGPNSPKTCTKDSAYGDQFIVLEVSAKQGRSEVVMRYDGCDHHGFDDGHAVRTLTRDAVHPFVSGPNRLTTYSSDLAAILAELTNPESASGQGSG